ncbi:MAG: adenylate/guanylate cyclase domain-containing protein [Spirochaetia bacterium]
MAENAASGGRAARAIPAGLRKVLQGLLMGAIGSLLALALWLPGALDRFEAGTWDVRARLFAKPGKATGNVITILLDQKSLEWGKKVNSLSWPWPREIYGAISDFCVRAGAKALVIDVFFTEPSVYGVSDDQALGAAASKNGRIVAAMNFGSEQATEKFWPADDPRPAMNIAGLEDWVRAVRPRRLSYPLAEFPVPEVFRSANILANAYLSPDAVDRVYRRAPLFNMFDGRVIPSEALATYVAGNPGAHQFSIRPGMLTLDGTSIPIDGDGRAILRYRGPSTTHKAYTAAAIVQADLQIQDGQEPAVPLALFRDKYVLFGFSAPGLFDLKPSPMKGDYPGVEIHATMLDNILSGDFMRPWPTAASILVLLLLCIGAAMAASAASGAGMTAIIYVLFIPVAPALGLAAYALGYWLQVVALELGVVISLVGSNLASYATEGQQKRYIKGAFRQYLSPTVIEELIAHPERLTLGGERRELTIFFSDVQGFTGISEALTPEDLTALLNEYLTAMVDIIQGEGGTIDKFEGDAIIAFWNAPLSQADHAVRGVRAALRCQARLAEMRPSIRERIGKNMFTRVGMNTGPAVVGNMGSKTRFDYTMLGDQVNLSARLEGINKQFGTYIMISGSTVEKIAGAFPARELSRVAVVGRKEPVTVYEPMLPEEFAARGPTLEIFDRGLKEFYAGRFAEAERIFEGIASVDPPAASYAKKCQLLAASPLEAGWSGVWVMTEK